MCSDTCSPQLTIVLQLTSDCSKTPCRRQYKLGHVIDKTLPSEIAVVTYIFMHCRKDTNMYNIDIKIFFPKRD